MRGEVNSAGLGNPEFFTVGEKYVCGAGELGKRWTDIVYLVCDWK
jgi:hypothetical protein